VILQLFSLDVQANTLRDPDSKSKGEPASICPLCKEEIEALR
jgi:hypothetical protein